MFERKVTDDQLTALDDAFCSSPRQRQDFAFYLPLVMSARAVLEVGSGTGALLHLARESEHGGRLCGLDPASGMLAQARQRFGIEWVQGHLSSVRWDRAFDLVVMTGHAFKELVGDDEVAAALAAIRSALVASGRFLCETPNPLVRGWERWPTEYSGEVTDAAGAVVRCRYRVEEPVEGGVVRSVSTFTGPGWDRPEVSRGALRFLEAAALARRARSNAGTGTAARPPTRVPKSSPSPGTQRSARGPPK